MENLEFKKSGEIVHVYLKNVRIFTINKLDNGRYWIGGYSSFSNFSYIGPNPDHDLDFIEYYKYSKTLDEAKVNCKKIIDSYVNWLTEK